MEPRRIYDYRSPHCQPHCTAASDPGYRSLRAFLLVKRQGAMDHLRKPWPHETHARERSRNRRERSDVPHSARPMSLFGIGQSQAEYMTVPRLKSQNRVRTYRQNPNRVQVDTKKNTQETLMLQRYFAKSPSLNRTALESHPF